MRRADISFEYSIEPVVERKFFTNYTTKSGVVDAIYWVFKIWRFRLEMYWA